MEKEGLLEVVVNKNSKMEAPSKCFLFTPLPTLSTPQLGMTNFM